MAGKPENLKPFNLLPKQERRSMARRGGLASGAARRAKHERILQEKAKLVAQNQLYREEIDLFKLLLSWQDKLYGR